MPSPPTNEDTEGNKRTRKQLQNILNLDKRKIRTQKEFSDQNFDVVYSPRGRGACQFDAIAYWLTHMNEVRIIKAQEVRNKVVDYMEKAIEKDKDWKMTVEATDGPEKKYITKMRGRKEWGDENTLRAASEVYNLRIRIISTAGAGAMVIHSPTKADDSELKMITIGFLHKEKHYVVLRHNALRELEAANEEEEVVRSVEGEPGWHAKRRKCACGIRPWFSPP